MKTSLLNALFLSLLTLAPAVQAAETAAVEPMTFSGATVISMDRAFEVLASKNGEPVTKTGEVFTEGESEGMELPYLLSNPTPIAYPRWAVNQGWEGEFVIAVEILTNGDVGQYAVMKSTGRNLLDDAAIEAVRAWKFHPATKDGEAVPTCVQIPVRFELIRE